MHDNVVVREITRPVTVSPDGSVALVRLDKAGIGTTHRDHLLYACLRDGEGGVVARTSALLDIERALVFPQARLDVRVQDGALALTTDHYAHSVHLTGRASGVPEDDAAFGWHFEDNWFDMLPGERKVVHVLGRHNVGQVTARPWYSPHETVTDWRRSEGAS
jgi:hypothetical protein